MYSDILMKTPEERIQFIFQSQNDATDVRLVKVGYLLENDPSPIVRHEAAYVLGEVNSEVSSKFLLHAIQNDPNRFVVHESALALGNLGDISFLDDLTKLLEHPDHDVVLTAEIAIERLKMKSNGISISNPKKVMIDLSAHPEHRIQAAFQLLGDGSLESISCLITALHQETNPIVKHEIIFSLGETSSKISSDALIAALGTDVNHFVIHESLLAISTLSFPDAQTSIQKYLSHEVDEVRESAEIALQRLEGV